MKLVSGTLRLSPTDLANYAACPHLISLDIAAARGELRPEAGFSGVTEALRKRGAAHEQAYIDHLKSQKLAIVDLRESRLDDSGFSATVAAMEGGAQIVAQAPLLQLGWAGRADILRRVETPSGFGGWSYEPLDTKLARETRGSTILQLCAYAAVLEEIQRVAPELLHVVSPGQPFTATSYRRADYGAYFRLLRTRLSQRIASDEPATTYPHRVAHCEICRWGGYCDAHRRRDDHLSLVANIRRLQIDQFRKWDIDTLAALGNAPVPFARKPDRGSPDALLRSREQARVQLAGRTTGEPVHECLPIIPDAGLNRLPEPSAGDIFFDIEGDPFVPDAGREYLFGYAYADESGRLTYDHVWGLTAAGEKAAFETFVDFVLKRWKKEPNLHIYHYAPYEPSALKRLMGRFGTREDDVDRMLRAELFVDLYAVVRQALRASVERYSIKALEPFYGYVREMPLADAGKHLRAMDMALEFNETDALPQETFDTVRRYNRDDCVSAAGLRDWLETLRADAIASGHDIPRPAVTPKEPDEKLTERETAVRALMDRLAAGVPIDVNERSKEQQARWLLAQLLEFHRREDKAAWWDFFRLVDLPANEYLDEPSALDGLSFISNVGGTEKCPIHRYAFPPQELKLSKAEVHSSREVKVGSVETFNLEDCTIDIKKTTAAAGLHPTRVFFFDHVRTTPIPETLFDIGSWVAAHQIDGAGSYRAVRDFLLNAAPRLVAGEPWTVDGESSTARARRLVVALDETVLPVQGPPGSGKTFIGAQMICALVRSGRKVGVTANSHNVIRNLLDAVVRQAEQEGLHVKCIHKVSSGNAAEDDGGPIGETTNNGEVLRLLESGERHVAGGTAWLWARPDMEAAVDVLVVDEAGQMSLANVAAAGRGARNLVLLGDPQQLEMPLKGSHPETTAVSVLQHVLGSAKTIAQDRGLFLAETWRLSPKICRFTSELFYDGRLTSRAGLERQQLVGPFDSPDGQLAQGRPLPFAGSGLWYAPVEHTGNQNQSTEEAETVAGLYRQLLNEYQWVDQDGRQKPIASSDILIVAPYNSQVFAIQSRLPAARVGTVDRFQGREAAVVIYSAATSSPEEAPRGMEFLYSLNRLNVATSRARCAVILVASPLLFEPDCQTPRQMQLANALCRYLEMALVLEPSKAT